MQIYAHQKNVKPCSFFGVEVGIDVINFVPFWRRMAQCRVRLVEHSR